MCAPPTPSRRQRSFARFMAGADDESHATYKDRKQRLLGSIRSTVVEIGPGTGVNLPFYHESVEWIGIEPNPAMHEHLHRRASELGRTIEIRDAFLADAGFAEGSIDVVVSTLVLCSVPSVETLLQDIRRVLKPGGAFIFIEHVADRRWSLRWLIQRAVWYTPWRYFSDGCRPARTIGASINAAGFAHVDMESYMQPAPGVVAMITRPHVAGVATR